MLSHLTLRDILALLPVFTIASLNWVQTILVLDRFEGFKNISKMEWFALIISLIGGFAAWISELSVKDEDLMGLQIFASLYRSFLSWIVLVLIVNQRLFFTRQQFVSLSFRMIITLCWEVQHRLVLAP